MLIRKALLMRRLPLPAATLAARAPKYSFSEDPNIPKSRQEAWMMQEQKRMKQKINLDD